MEKSFRFVEWLAIHEMAARRSFAHSMGKFQPPGIGKPVAVLTAWKGRLLDPTGMPYPEAIRRELNDEANRKLIANMKRRGLSFYPAFGGGQEIDDQGNVTVSKEGNFVVQPIGQMGEDEFLNHIRELLFNPTSEAGTGPFVHTSVGRNCEATKRAAGIHTPSYRAICCHTNEIWFESHS